jgi:protein transport protein YIF1
MQPQQDDYFGQAAPMAAQLGVNMVQSTIGKYLPFASALWQSLRYYFDVNNTYVQNKVKVLLAPFRHKHWQRLPANESGGIQQDMYNPVRA